MSRFITVLIILGILAACAQAPVIEEVKDCTFVSETHINANGDEVVVHYLDCLGYDREQVNMVIKRKHRDLR